nr:adenosylcobinamide-phosphate synthase CbiB [Prochlorococcus marinus]
MIGAVLLDLLIGDPRFLIHPVEIIGILIKYLKTKVEGLAQENIFLLRIGGLLLTFSVVFASFFGGWVLEQLLLTKSAPILKSFIYFIVLIALASSLASKSLNQSVSLVINALNNDDKDLGLARRKLAHIVGRNVSNLQKQEILRAAAESASENAVDGIFAPLFWMMAGSFIWKLAPGLPGPLAFAWFYKASSTIDSMIGYKSEKLRWIGESGAKLDDILTFIPCRLVLLTLPLISHNWIKAPSIIKKAIKDGSYDSSPNSGFSEAIFAYCAQVRMGGTNIYKDKLVSKKIIAKNCPNANRNSIKRILSLTLLLELSWVLGFILINKFILIL